MSAHGILEKIGLNDKEIRIYLALLKHGKMKPSQLAKQTGVSRPLVYGIAKNLSSKGIISEDVSGKTLQFAPLPPQNLERLVDEIRRETKERESSIRQAVRILKNIKAGTLHPLPKIRLIEEGEIERFLFASLVKWQGAILKSDGIWWGFQDHSFVENYKKWIKATWETGLSKKQDYKAQVFTNASAAERELGRRYGIKRGIRFLEGTDFTATTWVCGDYLIMIMTREHPFYLLEIYDPLMARNTAEIFKHLWKSFNT